MKLHLPTIVGLAVTGYALTLCPADETDCIDKNPSNSIPVDNLPIPFPPDGGVEPIVGYDPAKWPKSNGAVTPSRNALAVPTTAFQSGEGAPTPPRAIGAVEVEPRADAAAPGHRLEFEPNRWLIPYPVKHRHSMTTVVTTAMPTIAGPIEKRDDGPPKSTCTTTLNQRQGVHLMEMEHPVHTIYQSVVTATSGLNCGGCALEVKMFRMGGHGPMVFSAVTVTEEVTTTTVLMCIPSANSRMV